MVLSKRTDRNAGILWHLGGCLHVFLCNDDMSIIQVLEHPELGFQPKAECDHCLQLGGDIAGCHECGYKGHRPLTEDEEIAYEDGICSADTKNS